MLTLHRRPADDWKTVEIAPGSEIEVYIRRPNYEQLLAEQSAPSGTETIMLRLHAITDWRAVVDESGVPLPFSHEAMGDLIHGYPQALGKLLVAVRPFFEIGETVQKNSVAPPDAATPTNLPSVASTNSDALPHSPTPLG